MSSAWLQGRVPEGIERIEFGGPEARPGGVGSRGVLFVPGQRLAVLFFGEGA